MLVKDQLTEWRHIYSRQLSSTQTVQASSESCQQVSLTCSSLLLKPQLSSEMCERCCWGLSSDAYAMSHAAVEACTYSAGSCRVWHRYRLAACEWWPQHVAR